MGDDQRLDTRTETINRNIAGAWDRAGSLPAKEAVKVCPEDWHWFAVALETVTTERDTARVSLASAQERIAALEAGPQVDDAMVERAARGIVKRLGYDPDQPVGEIGGGRVLWQLSTGDARAALLAALTPTSET